MPPLSKQRKFELLTATFAIVEERGPTPLGDIASRLGVDIGLLRDLIDPLLFLEYRTSTEIVDLTRAFLLDEHGVLRIDEGHWLRNLRSVPPSDDDALRLFLAAQVVADEITPSGPLASARAKLAAHLGAEVLVEAPAPPEAAVVNEAIDAGRSLCCRYLGIEDDTARDRELLVQLLYHRWGRWYVAAIDVGDQGTGEPARIKHFRLDRMSDVRLGDRRYRRRDDVRPPAWFDIERPRWELVVRAPAEVLEHLTVPHARTAVRDLGDGRVEAELVVVGERMCDQLLVALGPDAAIVAPAALRERRRTWARELAERMCGSGRPAGGG
jgi:predicted DNA-binding transcriptional regulator YafY